MPSISELANWECLILVGGLFAVVLWKLLSGEIVLDQLLDGDIRDSTGADGFSTYSSMGRVQAFLVTVFVALQYLIQIIQNPRVFPPVSSQVLAVLAASHAGYLGGKAQAMLLGRWRDLLK